MIKAIRILTQVAFTGVRIVGRAFVDAYKVASTIISYFNIAIEQRVSSIRFM